MTKAAPGIPLLKREKHQSASTAEEGKMLPGKQRKAFGAFYKSARHNDILDEKTTLMTHLATSLSVACYP
jgi:hypothetical protein